MKTFNEFLEARNPDEIKTAEKSKLNTQIANIIKGFHEKIPLGSIFDILKMSGITAIQEDGTPWSGFLTGGAECGTPEAQNQRASIELMRGTTNLNSVLIIMWCKMQSGKYEVVAYLS